MRRTILSHIQLKAYLLIIYACSMGIAQGEDFDQYFGTYTLYEQNTPPIEASDTLTPIMINHVGRHGARYQTSDKRCLKLLHALNCADTLGTLTLSGREFRDLVQQVMAVSAGKWGALDSIGEREQRYIASWMINNFHEAFHRGTIHAISSYVPRCVMSMYSFCHEIARLDSHVEISTLEGRITSPMLRPFSTDSGYIAYRNIAPYNAALEPFLNKNVPTSTIKRLLGDSYLISKRAARDLAMAEYSFLASLSAFGIETDISRFVSIEEFKHLWECRNLEQYFEYCANEFSNLPDRLGVDLLESFITTTQLAASNQTATSVELRFAHAETLMPFLSLLQVPRCHYISNNIPGISHHWNNSYVVPMATNFCMVLYRSATGNHYVRCFLNGHPVILGNYHSYLMPWHEAKSFMQQCITGATAIAHNQII